MKRCPICQHPYTNETLNFCRHDGAALIPDSSPLPETQATQLLPPRDAETLPWELLFRPGTGAGQPPASSAELTVPLPQRKRRVSKTIASLAVLPLVNASDDPHAEYLSDGITESIINSLSQLPKLRVVPRSTVFRYKGRAIDPQAVGLELRVRAVLTGRVFQVGKLLVINTELIDVAQEAQLWGEQYRREITDIFALQEEISQEISKNLRLRLSSAEKKRLGKRYTENTEAYHFYLKGRYYTNKRTTERIQKGIEHFQQAIDLDPNYALAYAGLADAYAFLSSSTGERTPVEFYPKAQAAARKALELDETLAEAHTSLGFFHLMYRWDFKGAARQFKRAIELNPGYANAHDGYSFYFKATGQHEKAIAECRRAQQTDPLSLFAQVSLGWAYYFARQFESAVEQGRKALEMDQHFVFAYWTIGLSLVQQGLTPEALAIFREATALSGGGLTFKAYFGYVAALAGRHKEARRIIRELEKAATNRYVSSYYFSIIHLGLGEYEQTLAWLERSIEERSGFIAFLKVEPMFDPLRSDTRFIELEQRAGLR